MKTLPMPIILDAATSTFVLRRSRGVWPESRSDVSGAGIGRITGEVNVPEKLI